MDLMLQTRQNTNRTEAERLKQSQEYVAPRSCHRVLGAMMGKCQGPLFSHTSAFPLARPRIIRHCAEVVIYEFGNQGWCAAISENVLGLPLANHSALECRMIGEHS
eukprot:3917704-Pyramimonas_sp.AAC.1